MEKSTQNTNRVKSSQPINKESSSQKPTNIPQEYFNSGHPAPTEDQASQRPYFNDKQESDSQDATNIPQEYFNSNPPTADQASQRQYFNEVQSYPNNNNQPSQPVEPNYLDQGHPGYSESRPQDAFQTNTDSNNPTQANRQSLEGYPGYNENRPQYAFRTSSNSNANQAPQPRQRELTETMTFKGSNGQSYDVLPHLNSAQAREVEIQSGILLRKDSVNLDRYSGELGRGNFGRVYVAKLSNSNKYIVVKIIQGDNSALIESSHESTLQRKLTQATPEENSQLMPMYDAVEFKENGKVVALYTVLPLAALGSTKDLHKELASLDGVSGSLRRLLILHLAKGVLIGLYQMHKKYIYHLDVHGANVMINGSGKVQLSDFGTSEELALIPPSISPGRNMQGRFIGNGNRGYFPPERNFEQSCTFNPAKSDLYGLGALMWEFITGEQFPGSHSNQVLNHPLFQNPSPNSIANLAKQLLNTDPNRRLSVYEVLNHPVLCQSEVHDQALISTVVDFLKRFVRYSQLKAQGEISNEAAKQGFEAELRQSQSSAATSNDPLELNPLLKAPFRERPDVEEQLAMYLPLNASFKRKVEDPKKDSFDLYQHTQQFLVDPNQTLLLLLADGGSGKSLFMQYLTTALLQTQKLAPNGKPYLPLYIILSNIKNPDKLFEEGLSLTPESIHQLQRNYQVLILADGFDEQTTWANLYVQNQLQRYDSMQGNTKHIIKLIITCRTNALPPSYGEYFTPRVPGETAPRSMQEIYVQPFQTDQIDTYVANYIAQHKVSIQEQVAQKQLQSQWLDAKYVQEQINSIPGLKDLMQTPLLARLVLIALPELNKQETQAIYRKITRAQVYEAFMRQWVITQIRKTNAAKMNLKQESIELTEEKINQILAFGEKMALSMYRDNRAAQLNVGLQIFSFNPDTDKYHLNPSRYSWFEQGKLEQTLLPLQEPQKGAYKFVHLSMQEYLLARCLINELTQTNTLVNLTLNQLALTIEEKDRPILYFMGDLATVSKVLADKLFALINQTKTDKSQGIAGANAITVLNVSEVPLINRDFSNTSLPNIDLSGSVLMNTNFSNANLPNINLQGSKLNKSNFQKANLGGLQLGQYPMYRLKKQINAICYSPDRCYLAISQESELALFDVSTCKEIRRFMGHTNWINSVSFSPDGKRVATGSYDRTARIFDAYSGDCLKVLEGHTGEVTSVSFSGDGRRVATGSYDNTAQIYDSVSGDCLKVLSGHTDRIRSVSFSGDGKRVVTGSEDKTARIYNAASGECLKVLVDHNDGITSVSFSGDGKRVATGSHDCTVRIYDVESGDYLKTLVGHTDGIWSVSFSPDGKLVATGSDDCTARIYDSVSGDCLKVLSGHTANMYSVSFSRDSKLLATGGKDKTVQIWDVAARAVLKKLSIEHTDWINCVSFSPDRKLFATGSGDNTACIWSMESGASLKKLSGHTNWILSINFSPDGSLLATGSKDNTARIWDVKSGVLLKTLSGHKDRVVHVDFSFDGKILYTKDKSGVEKQWDVKSGSEFTTLRSRTNLSQSGGVQEFGLTITHFKNEVTIINGISQNKTIKSKDEEKITLTFPSQVKGISLCKSSIENKIILVVGFQTGVAFYSKYTEDSLSAFQPFAVNMTNQNLDSSGMNFVDSIGLSQANLDLLQQLSTPAEKVEAAPPDAKSKNYKSRQLTHPRRNDETTSTQANTTEEEKSQRSTHYANNNNRSRIDKRQEDKKNETKFTQKYSKK